MNHKIAYVHAVPQFSTVNGNDDHVAGIYEITLSEETPENAIANAALDGFHSTVPVKVLDDFCFEVRAGQERDSEVIAQAGDYEDYALSELMVAVERVADIALPKPPRP